MHIIAILRAVWQLLRPRTLVVIWLHLALCLAFLGVDATSLWRIGLALLAIAAWYCNAVAINDLSDEEVDALNLPKIGEDKDRPLINATTTRSQIRSIAWVTAFVAVISCLVFSPFLAVVALIMLGFNLAYSLRPIRLSYRGMVAQLLLPIGYVGFPATIAAVLAGRLTLSYAILVCGLYMIFVGRLFLKDLRDEVGDALVGKRTFLVRHGLGVTLWQAGIWIVAGIGFATVSISSSVYGVFVLIACVCVAMIMQGLLRCYKETVLNVRLLYVAVVGRSASCWLFCALLITLLDVYHQLDTIVQLGLIGLALGMFLFGMLGLFEEVARVKRKIEAS